jgi:hypothetical protein
MPADFQPVALLRQSESHGHILLPVFCTVPRAEAGSGTADRIQLITAPVLINKRTDFYFHL